MPEDPEDAPPAGAALLLIDFINDLDFEGGERLQAHLEPAAERAAALKRRARKAGLPVIYVNDNFGRWQSNWKDVVAYCARPGSRGRAVVERLHPEPDDFFVLKPRHSAFFDTALETLLRHLGVHTLVLTGTAGDICVLFTAGDAYMRGYRLVVVPDAVASVEAAENDHALRYMARVLDADLTASDALDLAALREPPTGRKGQGCRG